MRPAASVTSVLRPPLNRQRHGVHGVRGNPHGVAVRATCHLQDPGIALPEPGWNDPGPPSCSTDEIAVAFSGGQDSGAPAAGAPALPPVSVIIPARDAAATIAATLASVSAQDYPGPLEAIVADGSDQPTTADVIRSLYPAVQVIANPGRTAPAGLNAALGVSTGQVIVRCDSHATLPPDYVTRAVERLERTGAACVGGRQRPVGTTFFERAVAIAMTTWLGAGGARYRTGGRAGPADTVYLGVYRRAALEAVDGFDPKLVRNQDYDLHWRLRAKGAQVWFDPALGAEYRPRSTLPALARQYFDYGRWKRVALRQHPSSLRFRQLAAPLLVLGLAVSVLLAFGGAPWQAAAAVPLVYAATLLSGACWVGLCRRAPAVLLLPLVLGTMHLGWGAGFFLPART